MGISMMKESQATAFPCLYELELLSAFGHQQRVLEPPALQRLQLSSLHEPTGDALEFAGF